MESNPKPTSASTPSARERLSDILANFLSPQGTTIPIDSAIEEEEKSESSTMSHVTTGGVRIPLANRKKVVDDTTTAFYRKEDRDKLDAHISSTIYLSKQSPLR